MLQSVKISELPSADTLTEDDLIIVDQPDDTKKATLFQVLNHLEDTVQQSTLEVLGESDGSKWIGGLGYVNLQMFGDIDSVTDHTALLQTAINNASGVPVLIDRAINVSRVTLKSGSKIFGWGADAKIIATGSQSPLYGVDVGEIEISGLIFQWGGGSAGTAIQLVRCSNVKIQNNKTVGLSLLYTGETSTTYASITDETKLSNNIDVSCNVIYGKRTSSDGSVTYQSGIQLRWVADCTVSGNKMVDVHHGILWWGGDSNLSKDGVAINPRWARRITIVNNVVDGANMGGIWGSMGIDVTVTGNTVQNCYDVGIDFEGCINGVASGNTVRNCSYGCLTTFFYTRNILFIGNVCELDGVWTLRGSSSIATQLTNHLNGASGPLAKSDVTFRDNKLSFLGTDTLNIGKVGCTQLESLVFENNELTNVRLSFAETTQNGLRIIRNNRLNFNKAMSATFNAINCASNTGANGNLACQIEGNVIASSVTQPTGSIGIVSSQDYFNGALRTEVKNNDIYGFGISISVVDAGSNTGITHFWDISGNVASGTIKNDTPLTHARKGAWRLSHNLDFSGNPVPNTVPTSAKWIKNQRIELAAAPGGYLETVCTTAGTACQTPWVASTPYAVGATVFANSKVYCCTVAGTSGAVAPSHTSGTAIDGSVTWSFIDTLAVFKNCNQIAS